MIDKEVVQEYKKECAANGKSMRDVVEKLIRAWTMYSKMKR
jgi:hypothetical protein